MKKEQQWKVNDVYCFQIKNAIGRISDINGMWFVFHIVGEYRENSRVTYPIVICRFSNSFEMPEMDKINMYKPLRMCNYGVGTNLYVYRFYLETEFDDSTMQNMFYLGNAEVSLIDDEVITDTIFAQSGDKAEQFLLILYQKYILDFVEEKRITSAAEAAMHIFISENKEQLEKETPRDSCTYVGG